MIVIDSKCLRTRQRDVSHSVFGRASKRSHNSSLSATKARRAVNVVLLSARLAARMSSIGKGSIVSMKRNAAT